MGDVNLVVLARVLRTTTKKVVNFLRKKRENPGYAYESKSMYHGLELRLSDQRYLSGVS